MSNEIDPRLIEAARHDGTLRHMIKNDLPLTREKWMAMNYLGDPPKPWTAEHEAEVPEPWRHERHIED
jgi:hypothetical protein